MWRWLVLGAAACGRLGFAERVDPTIDAPTDARDPDAVSGAPNLVFVTSTRHVAGGLGGLAGADAICEARAAEAGRPGTYVAWLSTSSMDARDRLGTARGWVRFDGEPVADTAADVAAGRMFYPPLLDDLGAVVVAYTDCAATATGASGALSGSSCADFTTTSSESLACGKPATSTGSWTNGAAASCSSMLRLYCFGVDRVQPVTLPPPPSARRTAFLSQAIFDPGGGLAAADALCANEAAGLPGTFAALLATTTASAGSRFMLGTPWYRVDGAKFTDDFTKIYAPLNVTAAGAHLDTPPVWSGAFDVGMVGTDASTCSNWTAFAGLAVGYTGNASSSTTEFFLAAPTSACDLGAYRVYCLEQ